MNDTLPEGWIRTTLGEAADVSGGIQKSPKRRPSKNPLPMLRVANVGFGTIDLGDVHEIEVFEGEEAKYALQAGDILVVEGNGSLSQIGRAAMWRGEITRCVHQNHLLRVRAKHLLPRFLELYLHSPKARSDLESVASSTSGLHVLSGAKLKRLPVVVPPPNEQARIVHAVEEQLTTLDAADESLSAASRRLKTLIGAALQASAVAASVPLAEVLVDSNYGTSAKCDYSGSGPPVLRIPNIQSRRVSIEDLKYAKAVEDVGESAYVQDGDLLVVRTNGSRNLIGRTAVARAPAPSLAFASYLIRLQFDPARVLPEFASMMLESPRLRQEIEARAASSAGQYNLSLAKIKPLEIPMPSLADQGLLVDRFLALEEQARRFENTLRAGEAHSASLRRAVLSAAFAGHLWSRYDMEVTAA